VQGVESAEVDVMLRMAERPKEEVLAEIRERVTLLPGMNVTVGQPISHRIDHMLSGTRANIAVKVFGDDLTTLRSLARQVEVAMRGIDGVVDLSMEQQTDIPTVRVRVRPEDAARYGLQPGEVTTMIQTAFVGIEVNRVLEGQISFPMVVRYPEADLQDLEVIGRTLIDSPSGAKVPSKPSQTFRGSQP
jgi:Cu/Ag efflux pump CusA